MLLRVLVVHIQFRSGLVLQILLVFLGQGLAPLTYQLLRGEPIVPPKTHSPVEAPVQYIAVSRILSFD